MPIQAQAHHAQMANHWHGTGRTSADRYPCLATEPQLHRLPDRRVMTRMNAHRRPCAESRPTWSTHDAALSLARCVRRGSSYTHGVIVPTSARVLMEGCHISPHPWQSPLLRDSGQIGEGCHTATLLFWQPSPTASCPVFSSAPCRAPESPPYAVGEDWSSR